MRLFILIAVFQWMIPLQADDWKGQVVFPREADLMLRDKGDVIGRFLHDGKVVRDNGETLEIVQSDPFAKRDRQGVVSKKEAILASEAVDYFTGLVTKEPRTVFPLLQRARAYELAGKQSLAFADLKQAVNLSGQAAALHKAGIALHNQKKYPEAIAKYTEALKFDRSTALIYHNRGIVHNNLGNHDESLADISEAIWLQPKKESYYYDRGLRWNALKKHDRAISDFTKCIELNNSKGQYFFYRGKSHSNAGNTKAAISDYSAALHRDRNDFFSLFNRGLLYKKEGDLRKALADFEQAEKLKPDHEMALINLVHIHMQMEKYFKAQPIAERLVYMHPNNAENFVELAMCQRAQGHDVFSATLEKALVLDPDNAWARHERGLWHLDHCRWQQALEDHTRAITKAPKKVDAYAARAWAYAGLKKWNEAMKDLDEALTIDPKAVLPLCVKATLLVTDDSTKKNVEQAMDLVENAIKIAGERNPDVQAARAAVHAWRGEWKLAKQYQSNACIGNSNSISRFDRTFRYRARLYSQNQRVQFPEKSSP
ncbi:MAG: tetratricopeptide repeat protein [Planctomycetia bacterium]|nr:tetratricopeptide repeat protein [Planctomycetia bacterium]